MYWKAVYSCIGKQCINVLEISVFMFWKAVYLCIGLGEDYTVDSTLFYAYRYHSLTMIMVVSLAK